MYCVQLTLVPAGSSLVCLECSLVITQRDLVQLSQILLVCSRPSKVALDGVVVDGQIEHSCGIFWFLYSVCLEGFGERVCCIVRLVEFA